MGEGVPSSQEGNGQWPVLVDADVLTRIPGLRAVVLRLTRNLDTTNDIVQDAVMAVIAAVRAGRIRDSAALTAYMHQVARNMVAGQFNKPRLTLVEELPDDSLWSERPRTPLELLESQALQQLALSVLSELSTERDREVLTGYYIEGLSKTELMRKMEMTADRFDRVISRARGRMRDKMSEKLNGDSSSVRDSDPARLSLAGNPKTP